MELEEVLASEIHKDSGLLMELRGTAVELRTRLVDMALTVHLEALTLEDRARPDDSPFRYRKKSSFFLTFHDGRSGGSRATATPVHSVLRLSLNLGTALRWRWRLAALAVARYDSYVGTMISTKIHFSQLIWRRIGALQIFFFFFQLSPLCFGSFTNKKSDRFSYSVP